MSSTKQWFRRSAGNWLSQRRYIYLSTGKQEIFTSDLTVKLNEDEKDFFVTLSWESVDVNGKKYSEGDMLCRYDYDSESLHRNIGYFSDEPTQSFIRFVDCDTIVLSTEYGGMRFREEIRLLANDTVRLRQTLGWRGDTIFLVGQYFEKRVYPDDSATIS